MAYAPAPAQRAPAGFGGFGGVAYPVVRGAGRRRQDLSRFFDAQRAPRGPPKLPPANDHISMPVTQEEWEPYIGVAILNMHWEGSYSHDAYEYLGEFHNGRPKFVNNENKRIYWTGTEWFHYVGGRLHHHRIKESNMHKTVPPIGVPWTARVGKVLYSFLSPEMNRRKLLAWDDRRHHQFTTRTRKMITAMALIAIRTETPRAVHWAMVFEEMNEIDFAKKCKVDSKKPEDL